MQDSGHCTCVGDPIADVTWSICSRCSLRAPPPRDPLDADAWRAWADVQAAHIALDQAAATLADARARLAHRNAVRGGVLSATAGKTSGDA